MQIEVMRIMLCSFHLVSSLFKLVVNTSSNALMCVLDGNSFKFGAFNSQQSASNVGQNLPLLPIGPTDAQQNGIACMRHTACEESKHGI